MWQKNITIRHFTFKVNARRNNKTFPKTSMELNCDLGADLLDAYPDMTVDIHKPDVFINVEVRNVTYIIPRSFRDRADFRSARTVRV